MPNEWSPNTIFDIVADVRVRQILVATNQTPRSAQDLAAICDGSLSSIYRRIDVLTNYNLLASETKIDPDGHHYNVYIMSLDTISIYIEGNQVVSEIDDGKYTESHLEGH